MTPAFSEVLTPPQSGLQKKNGNVFVSSTAQNTSCAALKERQGTCALYVSEHFVTQTYQHFMFERLVTNVNVGGFVLTTFISKGDIRSMQLTAGGYRILAVPNAGGSSVVSEVLSFELLGRCFRAKLKKVRFMPL